MKAYCTLIILVTAILLIAPQQAHAGGLPIVYSLGGEKIIKVADFPRTEDFRSQDGQHVDAGYRYKQFTLFWIPLWNYGGEWCGYLDSENYLDISKADLDEVAREAGVELPEVVRIPFWDAYSGKLILGVLLVFGLMAGRASRHEETATAYPVDGFSVAAQPGLPVSQVAAPEFETTTRLFRIGKDGHDLGELPPEDINHMLRSGTLTLQDYFFDPDRNQWLPLASFPFLETGC